MADPSPRPATRARWPRRLRPRTIRARIYLTLSAITVLALLVAGVAFFFLLGGYQQDLSRARVRELAKAWGPQLFAEPGESETLADLLSVWETTSSVTGSIADEDDVLVLGLARDGRVAGIYERENRFEGERLPLNLNGLDPGRAWEGELDAPGGERLTYIVVALPADLAQTRGFCCVAVAAVGGAQAAALGDLAPRLLIAAAIALVVAGLVGLALSRSIYRPVQLVAAAARSVARGSLQQRVVPVGSQEAQELAQSFNQMTEEVERQQTALRDFLANVSHDLQTPLTSINGFSRALMDDVVEEEGRANAYRIIEDESRRLLRLVEGLLDLSRIEAGQVRVERAPVALDMLLEHIGDLFALRAEELDVHLSVETGAAPDALGDWDRLEQVLGNLVDNALRHTPPGGNVMLSARAESETSVSMSVADTGVGIPEEAIPNLFDRYYKSDRPGAQGGTGLGLAIAKELVRAQDGEIHVLSSQGVGTTFRVLLRAADDDQPADLPAAAPTAADRAREQGDAPVGPQADAQNRQDRVGADRIG